jgi:hypothetical protein
MSRLRRGRTADFSKRQLLTGLSGAERTPTRRLGACRIRLGFDGRLAQVAVPQEFSNPPLMCIARPAGNIGEQGLPDRQRHRGRVPVGSQPHHAPGTEGT